MTEVDVVILSLNRVESTLRAVDSALSQRAVRVRVWVIDQGSMSNLDPLREKAKKQDVNLVELPANIGVAAGRNLGAKLGKAPFIAYLDNDAVFADDDLLWQAARSLAGQVGVVGFKLLEGDSDLVDRLNWVYPKGFHGQSAEPARTARFPGGACMMKRSAFLSAGGFDELLFFMDEEIDLCYQLVRKGYHILYHPGLIVRHFQLPESRICWRNGRYAMHTRNMLYITWKHYGSWTRVLATGVAYLVKGVLNGIPMEALRGGVAGWRLSRKTPCRGPLSAAARSYIEANHDTYRGNLFVRLKNELFSRLPQVRPAHQHKEQALMKSFKREESRRENC